MVTKSSREMQKDREKVRPPFGGLKFCQGTHYLPLTIGESFYMLPVSIFELMIVPESQADEVEEMKKAIIESNKELPAEYLLSNSVYYYGDKGEAEIAG